jgi:hypothetical protein
MGARRGGKGAFLVAAFVLGTVGTTLYSEWADTFVLTWPASLYVGFRVLLSLAVWAGRQRRTLAIRLRAAAALAVFLAICVGYFKLCAAIDFPVGWFFLMGFLPSAPAAALAANQQRGWLRWVLDSVGFGVFFFAGGLLPEWKTVWG